MSWWRTENGIRGRGGGQGYSTGSDGNENQYSSVQRNWTRLANGGGGGQTRRWGEIDNNNSSGRRHRNIIRTFTDGKCGEQGEYSTTVDFGKYFNFIFLFHFLFYILISFFQKQMPLLDYLCSWQSCTLKELQVLFNCLERRRIIIQHLRREVLLRTAHLRPPARNFLVRCNDISAQPAASVPALNGYLGITVCNIAKKNQYNSKP